MNGKTFRFQGGGEAGFFCFLLAFGERLINKSLNRYRIIFTYFSLQLMNQSLICYKLLDNTLKFQRNPLNGSLYIYSSPRSSLSCGAKGPKLKPFIPFKKPPPPPLSHQSTCTQENLLPLFQTHTNPECYSRKKKEKKPGLISMPGAQDRQQRMYIHVPRLAEQSLAYLYIHSVVCLARSLPPVACPTTYKYIESQWGCQGRRVVWKRPLVKKARRLLDGSGISYGSE